MKINKPMYFSLALVCVVLGIMLALQFRGTTDSLPYDRPQELTQELSRLEQNYNVLLAEAADLQNSLEKIQQGSNQSYEALQNELKKLRKAAGLEPVTGPGVEVIVRNMPKESANQYNPNIDSSLFSIKYDDLLRLVNELNAAGAEAVSINGQRLIATSEIRSAGNFIDVNLTRVSDPYHILAIGDPEKLESSLKIKGGLVETLKDWAIDVQVEKKEEITIPAYRGILEFNYAKPLKEGEK